MERTILNNDITVLCETAKSFPDGVLAAHQKLHGNVSYHAERKYYGISHPVQGKIVYRAAVEELEPGELSRHHLETFVIKKGTYVFIDVKDYMTDESVIGNAFEALLTEPTIDPKGCCVEYYVSDTVCRCMIRLRD